MDPDTPDDEIAPGEAGTTEPEAVPVDGDVDEGSAEPATGEESVDEQTSSGAGLPATTEPSPNEIDLEAIESDLDAVQAALSRLADGSYWTDEVTGDEIPAEVLASDPLARRS